MTPTHDPYEPELDPHDPEWAPFVEPPTDEILIMSTISEILDDGEPPMNRRVALHLAYLFSPGYRRSDC